MSLLPVTWPRKLMINTLTASGMDDATADRWCDAWEFDAANREASARRGIDLDGSVRAGAA
jgi:hypothetical protein